MSLRGYVKKGKPAIWMKAFPATAPTQAKPKRVNPVSKVRRKLAAGYPAKARAFVKAARARGERCPVVAAVPELRTGHKYGHPISDELVEVHHIYGRGHGGRGPLLMDERLWMAVSKQGHRWIESNKEQARSRGWLAPSGHYNVPVPPEADVTRNQWGGVEVRL